MDWLQMAGIVALFVAGALGRDYLSNRKNKTVPDNTGATIAKGKYQNAVQTKQQEAKNVVGSWGRTDDPAADLADRVARFRKRQATRARARAERQHDGSSGAAQ